MSSTRQAAVPGRPDWPARSPRQLLQQNWQLLSLPIAGLVLLPLLVIFSGFWGMINVLFGFMPLYIESFTDLGGVEAAGHPQSGVLQHLGGHPGEERDGGAGHGALDGGQRHLVDLAVVESHDPGVALEPRIDFAGGGIHVVGHEIDREPE